MAFSFSQDMKAWHPGSVRGTFHMALQSCVLPCCHHLAVQMLVLAKCIEAPTAVCGSCHALHLPSQAPSVPHITGL